MNRSALLPYACGAGAILCWASLAAAIGKSLRGAAPETVLFWGLLLAGLALAAWERLRGRHPLRWPGWRVAAYGVYGIWGYHTLLVTAFSLAPQVQANILNYTWTLWIVLLGGLLPGHRFTARMALAGLCGFAGVALVIGGNRWWSGGAAGALGTQWAGFALALAAALTWSTFTVFMRRLAPADESHMALFCLLGAGAALAWLLLRGAPLALPGRLAPVVAYLGLVPLGLSFVLWERAARTAQMQVLGLMSFATPVLSTLLLSLVTGAPVGPALYGGLALILAGAALGGGALRAGARPAPDAAWRGPA